ncbi:MAG: diaminopimelate decarboxylase family protein, partial [Eubacteriales bacterium]
GRSIVAAAGSTLYTCGTVKTVTGFRSYVSVDGGMPDNPRYTLYQSQYTILNASHADREADFECTVAGRCCESGDLLAEGISIAKPVRGDIIAVLVTGAYNYSMASNYNRVPRPPIIEVSGGVDKVAVRRETYEDLISLDL